VIGIVLVTIAVWLFWATKKRDYHSLIAGLALLMIATNALIHIFIFPEFNKLKIRSFAERVGALVEPGSDVGMYRSAMSYKFNFYSQIKRLEKLESPEDIETFLSTGDAKYILTRQRFESEIRSVSQNSLQLALAETIGRERWMLLSWCKQGCAPVAASARWGNRVTVSTKDASKRHHGH
jgi:hypothetical protein